VVNRYVDGETLVARETTRYQFRQRPNGYLIEWDTTIEPLVDGLYFGDIEEMGLGVRVGTAIAVKRGKGRIVNSAGDTNEKGTWGKPAEWCDYAAAIGDAHVGVTLMAHHANPHKTWFHSRDYGLVVANSFGPRAGAPAKLPVPKGQPLRLRFGIFVHEAADAKAVDVAAEYAAFAGGQK
jgi:hypothetical protein